ncbi:MAG: hypothetical protein EPN72_07615 [Nevskiaceae bacterium]|nr:MAG: hypothetical protein EPN63_04995 [Nevskiaceae bacterium]TBR73028.1 MAG: hypothetical protein EPN72_07615 [Nevskiaceae bacterium]
MTSRLHACLAVAGLCLSPLALAAGFSWGATPSSNAPLLKATQAFVMQNPEWDGKQVELKWSIAPGYYLYRDRIHVKALDGGATGKLALPAGRAHNDPAFGKVDVYRDRLTAEYTPAARAAETGARQLEVTFQGCADRGVCYPPLTRTVSLPAPSATR